MAGQSATQNAAAAVTMRGEPVTLEGRPPAVGDKAPNFTATANDMSRKQLSDWAGKTVLLSSVPSLDTPVCDAETRSFNERAAEFNGAVHVVTISMDLPFAQKRWCAANGIGSVTTLSDFNQRDFAKKYGLRMSETGLLARAVFVIAPDGTIMYREIVPEVTTEPNYDAAIKAAEEASGG